MTKINNQEIHVQKGQSYEEILKTHFPDIKNVTCVLVGDVVKGLYDEVLVDKTAEFLTTDRSEESARVYARGVMFLVFRAIRQIFGEDHSLLVDHMISSGYYCEIIGINSVSKNTIKKIEKAMKVMVQANTPFVYHEVTKQQGVELFKADGQYDKVRLFKYRDLDRIHYYENDGEINYFYGNMVPSTGYLENFHLMQFADGFIVKTPMPFTDFNHEFLNEPKYYDVIKTAEKWAKILSVKNVSDINKLCDLGQLDDFIRVNEALHESKIADIAKQIVHKKNVRIVLISGPSSSGKTTFAGRLRTHLMVHGKKSHLISLDDYYIDTVDLPKGENGKIDYETIDALDTALFNENMLSLLDGKETNLPCFSFKEKARICNKPLKIGENDILVVEGIHGLNDQLTRLVMKKFKFSIFISPLTTLNLDNQNIVYPEDLRLLRRMVRDHHTRGYGISQTLMMWHDVRHGEFKYILPYKENADVMFNSTLLYEPMILKKYAMDELLKIKEDAPEYRFAIKLIEFLKYFASSDLDDVVDSNSLLREFIG